MWSLSSLHRPFSSLLLGNHGGLNFISYMSSRFAAFTAGWLGNPNEISHPDNVQRGESEKKMLQSSGNFRTSMDLFAEKGNVSNPFVSKFQSFYPSTGWKDVETQRTNRTLDFVRGIIEEDSSRLARYNVEHNADIVHIKLKRNNAFVNVTDSKGNTKLRASSGFKDVSSGGKVSRYAAEATAEYAGRKAKDLGLKSVVVKVNGFTYFKRKRQAIISFREGFTNSRTDQNPIVYIEDNTRRPHNGCRLPKKRRV